jgi:hypothetical protein
VLGELAWHPILAIQSLARKIREILRRAYLTCADGMTMVSIRNMEWKRLGRFAQFRQIAPISRMGIALHLAGKTLSAGALLARVRGVS